MPKEKNGWNWRWLALTVLMLFFLFVLLNRCLPPVAEKIIYSDFSAKLDAGEVTLIVIQENSEQNSGTVVEVRLKDGKKYEANFPIYLYPELPEKLAKSQAPITINQPSSNWSFLIWLILPAILLLFLFVNNPANKQFKEAKSLANDRNKLTGEIREKFADVAGIEEVKEEVADIVDFLRDPGKYQKMGACIPRGVLLSGDPGTGKTLLARAIAGESGVPFFSVSGSGFVEMFVGVGASRVRSLFEKARKNAPAIVFIDEIDAVGRRRGAGLGNSNDEREQTLDQIFVEMDGFNKWTNVIVLAATNRPDILDPALLRPGRFDRIVIVNKPDVKGREAILKVHTKDKPLAEDVDIEKIAKSSPGATGAILKNLVNEAAIVAVKRGESAINNACFLEAADRILMGKERKLVMSPKDKELIAYHEAGHVVVSKALPGADPVRNVSITARDRSLGQTLLLPAQDRYIVSQEYLQNLMKIYLGGRSAEEIFLQTKSTGAENDLRIATETAQKMVCSFGMSKLGPRAFGVKEEEIFLGREITRKEDVSPQTLREIDEEVAEIVREAYKESKGILFENKEKVEALVRALLEKETLNQAEIDALWSGKPAQDNKAAV